MTVIRGLLDLKITKPYWPTPLIRQSETPASSIFQGCLEEIDQTDQDQEPQLVEILDLFRYKVAVSKKIMPIMGYMEQLAKAI
jgi:hypothetical protein